MSQQFVENFKLNKLINDRLKDIRKKNPSIKPNAKGSYSYCYNFKDFVILKNISKLPHGYDSDSMEQTFERKQQIFNDVKSKYGVNIATHYCCYAGSKHFYVIQERLEGEILSVHYPSTARAIAKGKNAQGEYAVQDDHDKKHIILTEAFGDDDERDIASYEYPEVARAVSRRNNAMLKQLKNAEQKHFDKFVRDFKILLENGILIDTTLSENFLYDKKKGFSFVDLDVAPEGYKVPSDFDIALKCFDAFQDFNRFRSLEDTKVITSNFADVRAKLLDSVLHSNLKLTDDQQTYLQALAGVKDKSKQNNL